MRDLSYLSKIPNILTYKCNPTEALLTPCKLYITNEVKVLAVGDIQFVVESESESELVIKLDKASECKAVENGLATKAYVVPQNEDFKYGLSIGGLYSDLNITNTYFSTDETFILNSATIRIPAVYAFLPTRSKNGVGKEHGIPPLQQNEKDWWEQ